MKSISLMSLLLRFHGYPPATFVAISLHAGLLYLLLDRDLAPSDLVSLDEPAYISALTIQENPQRLRRIENERRQTAAEENQRREQEAQRQRERDQEAERQRTEQANREQAEREAEQQRLSRERLEQERLAEQQRIAEERAIAEAQERDEALRQQQAEALREQQEASRRANEQAASDDQTAAAYKSAIIQAISNNWSIPPSARNGMRVVIQLNLVPTGEVVAVNIQQSSGDDAFDRSALQAVARADSFPIVQQMPNRVFERGGFRSISLIFRPEDLLR